MGIYINMELPDNCINCAARHGAECWLADCSYIPNSRKERPKWCPLVTLPPHGRLGDLDALMLVADRNDVLVISGTGEVIEPDAQYVAIGSGGNYAYAAAHALYDHTDMTAAQIAEEALKIASDICVYTNSHISVETLSEVTNG